MRAFEIFTESELFLEAEIPATEYGYWISPEGEISSVPYQGHYQFMVDNHNIDVNEALQRGWIRVITHGNLAYTLEVEVGTYKTTARAISILRRLATSGGFDNFNVEIINSFGDRNFKQFNRSGPFLNLIQQVKA